MDLEFCEIFFDLVYRTETELEYDLIKLEKNNGQGYITKNMEN